MTSDEDATPALLAAKPSWLITQLSARAHRLLASHLATGNDGDRGNAGDARAARGAGQGATFDSFGIWLIRNRSL